MIIPNSSAMDATAASGGPSTMLPQIVTGQPTAIASHVTGVLAQVEKYLTVIEDLTKATQSLSNVWSGAASETATKKITDTLSAFQDITKALQTGATLLGVSGAAVKTAQTGYTSVVSAVNPTVASLMSNPWTYGAAVGLSTSTSGMLRGFITAIEGVLQALGGAQMLQVITTVLQIIQTIEKLAGGTSTAASTAGATPTVSTIAPIGTAVTPPPVASVTGQQVSSLGQDPTVSQILANGGATASTPAQGGQSPSSPSTDLGYGLGPSGASGSSGSQPSTDLGYGLGPSGSSGSDSWIPVDPSSSGAGAAAPAGGQPISVTTTHDGVTTTVELPAGQASDVSIGYTVDGQQFSENIGVTADGKVSVD